MKPRRTHWVIPYLLFILGLAALAGITWGNYNYTRKNPGGNDFLVHWMGSRALLEEGVSPYSDEVAMRIQTFAYGRPARPGEHELRVAYPLYSTFLFIPFALIKQFELARAAWMTLLELGLVGMVFLSLRLFRWRSSLWIVTILILFSLFWYHGLRPLINGNAVILVAVFLWGGLLALRNGADELAGVLFAFSTIKPQVVVVILVFIIAWALVQRRLRMLIWFFASLFLLVAGAALILPDWLIQNIREVIRYPSYNPPGTPGSAFQAWWPTFGQRLGWLLTILVVLTLLVEWWAARKAEMRGFLWAVGLTLTASQWIGIQTDPGNFVILLPVLVMCLALLDERWRGRGNWLTLLILFGLFVGLWALFLTTVEHGDQPIQSPIMFFPLPAFLLLLLYWVRWWAVQLRRPWLEQIDI